jgi:hypothetical protein
VIRKCSIVTHVANEGFAEESLLRLRWILGGKVPLGKTAKCQCVPFE